MNNSEETKMPHISVNAQYIKLGAFVGGANLEQVSEQQGKEAVAKLKMATNGNCSK